MKADYTLSTLNPESRPIVWIEAVLVYRHTETHWTVLNVLFGHQMSVYDKECCNTTVGFKLERLKRPFP